MFLIFWNINEFAEKVNFFFFKTPIYQIPNYSSQTSPPPISPKKYCWPGS